MVDYIQCFVVQGRVSSRPIHTILVLRLTSLLVRIHRKWRLAVNAGRHLVHLATRSGTADFRRSVCFVCSFSLDLIGRSIFSLKGFHQIPIRLLHTGTPWNRRHDLNTSWAPFFVMVLSTFFIADLIGPPIFIPERRFVCFSVWVDVFLTSSLSLLCSESTSGVMSSMGGVTAKSVVATH